ncbi:MAG: hypothetical protein IIA75_09420, partial [Proteobacteria bacterium]|nr:hypothetical protein [Pseudomonadota bacterium]
MNDNLDREHILTRSIPYPMIAGPGSDIFSADFDGRTSGFRSRTGSSMAAPFVTAALVKYMKRWGVGQSGGGLTPLMLKQRLFGTADPFSIDPNYSNGRPVEFGRLW